MGKEGEGNGDLKSRKRAFRVRGKLSLWQRGSWDHGWGILETGAWRAIEGIRFFSTEDRTINISYRSASKRGREAAGLINSVYAGLTVPWRQVI